ESGARRRRIDRGTQRTPAYAGLASVSADTAVYRKHPRHPGGRSKRARTSVSTRVRRRHRALVFAPRAFGAPIGARREAGADRRLERPIAASQNPSTRWRSFADDFSHPRGAMNRRRAQILALWMVCLALASLVVVRARYITDLS